MGLLIIGKPKAYKVINRKTFYEFLIRQLDSNKDGSFTIHDGGETDIRAAYCGIAVASVCNFLNEKINNPQTVKWLAECQTYQGGFGTF